MNDQSPTTPADPRTDLEPGPTPRSAGGAAAGPSAGLATGAAAGSRSGSKPGSPLDGRSGHGGGHVSGESTPTVPATSPGKGGDGPAKSGGGGLLRFFKTLARRRNGDQLRDTIGELIEADIGAASAIDPDERQLIKNILSLHDISVHDVMVPRADIVAVEIGTSLPALVDLLAKESHSRIPVYKGSLDEVLGMVHIKDVMPFWSNRRDFRIERIMRKVLFAAPSMKLLDLLAEMRRTHTHLALVVDEFGGIDGLVTIEDLVEEIVGEIQDEHDEPDAVMIVEEKPGVAKADARAPIEELERLYGPLLTDDEREDVDTLGGLVFYVANRVPSRGELIPHMSGIEFEVVDADPRRVRRIRVRNLPPRIADEAQAGR